MPAEEQNQSRNPVASFFGELRRRRVLQMGGAYVAGAWLGAEIISFLLEQFLAPAWTYRFVAIVLVVGFPLAIVLAWIVQVRDDGSWAIDPERGDHRTVAAAIVLGVLVTAGLSWLIVPERQPEAAYEPMPNSLAIIPPADSAELHRSLMAGLERSRELTLVRLDRLDLPDDLYDFGRNLKVAFLASGGADMQLLDIANEKVAWSQKFRQDDEQLVATGNAIVNELLEAMSLPSLSQQEFTGTDNLLAYRAYLAGRQSAADGNTGGLRSAIDEYQRALELDPAYVRAHVGLAEAVYELLDIEQLEAEKRDALRSRAQSAVEQAQGLDRESAAAISLLGLADVNRQLRIQAFERAIELDPDHHPSYYRYALQMKEAGDFVEAENLLRKALSLYPTSRRYEDELALIIDLRDSSPGPR